LLGFVAETGSATSAATSDCVCCFAGFGFACCAGGAKTCCSCSAGSEDVVSVGVV
jgi:hypothetical protein